MSSRDAHDARPALLSALAALVVYAVTLGGTYVYDDRYIVLADPRLESVAHWGELWTKDYFNGGADNLYRPLVSMTYAVQAKLHGRGDDRAWAFHLVNWLLHAGASAALAETARRVSRSSAIALVAGLLFAVHPIHVEAVANIVGRAELLCGLSIFTALALFMRPLTAHRALAIWACQVVAVLSKEQGMFLPLLLLLAIPLRRDEPSVVTCSPTSPTVPPPRGEDAADAPTHPREDRRTGTPALLLILLIVWTLASYLYVRENTLKLKFWWDRAFLDATINPLVLSTGVDRWLLPFALFGRYVVLLVAPLRPLPDYGGDVIGSAIRWDDPYLYVGFTVAIFAAAACIFAVFRRRWLLLFGLGGFAIIYAMISNFPTLIGVNFAERLMYIPSAFACLLAAIALVKLPRRATVVLASVVVVLFAARTVTYAHRWSHPRELFERGIAQEPRAIHLYMLLTEEYERSGELALARDVMARARDVKPEYYKLWVRSAWLALAAGDYDQAMTFARRAFELQRTMEIERLFIRISEERERATAPAGAGSRPATGPTD